VDSANQTLVFTVSAVLALCRCL